MRWEGKLELECQYPNYGYRQFAPTQWAFYSDFRVGVRKYICLVPYVWHKEATD